MNRLWANKHDIEDLEQKWRQVESGLKTLAAELAQLKTAQKPTEAIKVELESIALWRAELMQKLTETPKGGRPKLSPFARSMRERFR